MNWLRFALVCLLTLGALAPRMSAGCTICLAYPHTTAADYLLNSSCVVFAREDPLNPFSYKANEVLKGEEPSGPIDLFVDSHTRRMLTTYPTRQVVLAFDAKHAKWRSLGLADREYASVVRKIVLLGAEWRREQGRRKRVEFFSQLFGHEHPMIYELAYLEMARAPYSSLKPLSRLVPRSKIEPILRDRQYIKWRSLAILLMAQKASAADRKFILHSFSTAARFGLTTNLAALAAGAVELEGEKSIQFIERHYLEKEGRRKEEIAAILKALSTHGTEGRTELRDRIVESYALVLKNYPGHAGALAQDLLRWERRELVQQLSHIHAGRTTVDYAAKDAIRRYLAQARR